MSLRVTDRLGVADVVTLLNAVLGVGAISAALVGEPGWAARIILLAASPTASTVSSRVRSAAPPSARISLASIRFRSCWAHLSSSRC